ncbi:hypothetical protein DM01DRAFT_1339245 [Hesseltinella vesiculosa]|uniref:CNH-domain-containing protein n=1 Tax=Hesseltinella vesiculosa TaxID=101127 RepID=A0A1X2G7U1_9FUNG|nr:hypothetical protein DM01DRAFT_1339245 [Hesseltinella vesiculosa]
MSNEQRYYNYPQNGANGYQGSWQPSYNNNNNNNSQNANSQQYNSTPGYPPQSQPAGHYYNTHDPNSNYGHNRTSSYGSNGHQENFGYPNANPPYVPPTPMPHPAQPNPTTYGSANNYYGNPSNSGYMQMPQPRPSNGGGIATTVSPLDFASPAVYPPTNGNTTVNNTNYNPGQQHHLTSSTAYDQHSSTSSYHSSPVPLHAQQQHSSRPSSQASSTTSGLRPASIPAPIDTSGSTYRSQPTVMTPVSPLDSSDDDDYSPTPLDVMRKLERNNQSQRNNRTSTQSHDLPTSAATPPAASHPNGHPFSQPQSRPTNFNAPVPPVNTSNVVEPPILSSPYMQSSTFASSARPASPGSANYNKVLPPAPRPSSSTSIGSKPRPSSGASFSGQNDVTRTPSRPSPPRHSASSLMPPFNPAMLSELSSVFVKRIRALEHVREISCSDDYPDAFSGQEAVTAIYKALDGKVPEQYCILFATSLMRSQLFQPVHYSQMSLLSNSVFNSSDEYYYFDDDVSKEDVPRGVLTSLTKCYSSSCVPEEGGCYAPLCPNKPAVFAKEFSADADLARETSFRSSLEAGDLPISSEGYVPWGKQVARELYDSTPKREKERQEAINELIFNEENYMKDLTTMHEVMVTPLLEGNIIEPSRVKRFVEDVFVNYNEIRELSTTLYRAMYEVKRRYEGQCLPKIGDVIVQHVAYFEKPYTKFGPQVPMSEYILNVEMRSNPEVQRWYNDVVKNPRLRRLDFRAFLVTPAQRIGRFMLLLEAVLKKTNEDHEDYPFLTRCIDMARPVAARINQLKLTTDQRVEILQINDSMEFKQGESYNLNLTDPHRKLLHSGELKRQDRSDSIHAFVFDHMFVMAKVRTTSNNAVEYRVWKRPVPLQMLIVANAAMPPNVPAAGTSNAFPLVLNQLSQGGYQHIFYCSTQAERQQWIQAIDDAKNALKRRQGNETDVLEMNTLDDSSFRVYGTSTTGSYGRINCSVPFATVNDEYRIAIGTDTGVYFKSLKDSVVRRVISCDNVRQLNVLASHNILLVLSEKILRAYPLDPLNDPTNIRSPDRLCEEVDKGVNFFSVGICNQKHLLLYKKRSSTDSLFVSLEPKCDLRSNLNESMKSNKKGLSVFGRSNNSWFLKDMNFNIGGVDATNLQFFKTKFNVACDQRCFQVINPNNLNDIRDIPDNSYPEFNFISNSAEPMKPLAMFRIEKFFLVCYDRVAFYVHNRNGSLVMKKDGKPYILCEWEGRPEHVTYIHPYVIGVCTQFLEVRNVESGELVQVISGENIRLTYYDEQLNLVHCCMTNSARPEVQHLFHLYLDPSKVRNTGYPSRQAVR